MAKKSPPITHHVEIIVEDNGNFSYTNGLVLAARRQRVRWTCNHDNFTISFSEGTPFSHLQFESSNGRIAAQTIRGDADLKEYHYKVAVGVEVPGKTGEGAFRIFLNGGCPEVQVGS